MRNGHCHISKEGLIRLGAAPEIVDRAFSSEAGQELRRLYYGFPEDSTWADPAAREAVAAGQKSLYPVAAGS